MSIARVSRVILVLICFASFSNAAQAPDGQVVTTISELMLKFIQPNSDAVFYIARDLPQSEADWLKLQTQTLLLVDSAQLLLQPGYFRDEEAWSVASILLRDAALAASEAAKTGNMDKLIELNNDLYTSCENCHETYRSSTTQ